MRKCPHDGSECRWIDDCWFCPECREEFYPLPDEADDPEGYSLVMPFVVVASRGGPFDDQAYAAGWEMGAIEVRLQMACLLGLGLPHVTVLRSNLPQIELLAMKHGLLITENEWPDYVDAIVTDTWAFLSFSQGGET